MLSQRLAQLRKERNLTQTAVAAAVGVSRSTIASIEAGHDYPGRKTLIALARLYGVSLDSLVGVSGPPTPALDEQETKLLEAFRALPPQAAQEALESLIHKARRYRK